MKRDNLARSKVKSFFEDFILPVSIGLILVVIIRLFIIGLYFVPSGSMLPTLQIDDHVIVTKLSYKIGEPNRGDIIVFSYPVDYRESGKNVKYVKRLIGLPEETLAIKDNKLYINGKHVSEPYLSQNLQMDDFGPVEIGADEYFVMGDNRNHSNDSRYWGTVPRKLLVGKVQAIYWPFKHFKYFVS